VNPNTTLSSGSDKNYFECGFARNFIWQVHA
jgi:hypothetical protein